MPEDERPERDIFTIITDIERARSDYRKLDVVMAKANLEHTLEWDGTSYSLMEALQLSKKTSPRTQ